VVVGVRWALDDAYGLAAAALAKRRLKQFAKRARLAPVGRLPEEEAKCTSRIARQL
jgi:hypothetical protein